MNIGNFGGKEEKLVPMRSLIVALIFIAFDIISGLVGALKNGNYKSSVMRNGLFHKVGEIFAIIFSYGCEEMFPFVGITVNLPICQSVLIYIIIMETGSIVENITNISPELKNILGKVFKSYRNDDSTSEGKHEKH